MFKIAANLSHLWAELPYLDRFDAAAKAGFDGVEVLFPYDMPAKDTRRALLKSGLPMILMNAPPPNYTGGARGFAAVPEAKDRFRFDMRRALRYCDALRVPMLHVMIGPGVGAAARETLINNLRWASEEVPENVTLLLEPLNADSMPGYYLNDYDLTVDILRDLDAPNVALQFDSFHAQMIHGDAVAVYEKHKSWVRHIQIGDAPGRVTPGNGEVDFTRLFECLKTDGYGGWVSAEYAPGPHTEDSLEWLRALRS
ncbi:Hydroxypyruvate isomerase [Roseobacter fucihabitans]|uniref:Hydroxypyruvate isomerase n=1 Tax=Roseobacter fucihabitans TaxID=1537242 RepID=A0ABZ2C1K5_9RHOB|nr:TIM barrel protein [Roseobacter litoralis]MBC6964144.1 Hydroxypyruvate isomerase [Roseobacter litoralis]